MTPTALLLHTRLACLTGLAISHHSFTLPSLILLLTTGSKWYWELTATSLTPAAYLLTAYRHRLSCLWMQSFRWIACYSSELRSSVALYRPRVGLSWLVIKERLPLFAWPLARDTLLETVLVWSGFHACLKGTNPTIGVSIRPSWRPFNQTLVTKHLGKGWNKATAFAPLSVCVEYIYPRHVVCGLVSWLLNYCCVTSYPCWNQNFCFAACTRRLCQSRPGDTSNGFHQSIYREMKFPGSGRRVLSRPGHLGHWCQYRSRTWSSKKGGNRGSSRVEAQRFPLLPLWCSLPLKAISQSERLFPGTIEGQAQYG